MSSLRCAGQHESGADSASSPPPFQAASASGPSGGGGGFGALRPAPAPPAKKCAADVRAERESLYGDCFFAQDTLPSAAGADPPEPEDVLPDLSNIGAHSWRRLVHCVRRYIAPPPASPPAAERVHVALLSDHADEFPRLVVALETLGVPFVGRLLSVLVAPFFFGFIHADLLRRFLAVAEEGSFLCRCSDDDPLAFIFEVVLDGALHTMHVLCAPDGFRVYPGHVFSTLDAMLAHWHSTFRVPFTSPLPRRPYFFGFLDNADARALLHGKAAGAFLLRFSSLPGSYAVSFVGAHGRVRKSLIQRDAASGQFLLAGAAERYDSVLDVVLDFQRRRLWTLPMDRNTAQCARDPHNALRSESVGLTNTILEPLQD